MRFNILTRLTLLFTLIVTIILALFSIAIFLFSSNYRQLEFYSRLENKAINTARLLIEVHEIDINLLKVIEKNTVTTLINEQVIIYDNNNEQIYNSLENISSEIPQTLLDRIRSEKTVRFNEGRKEIIGIVFPEVSDQYVVIVSAYDLYGKNKINFLRWILITGFLFSTGLTIFLGINYAKNSLKPISDVVKQVDKITAESLHVRLDEGNKRDEIERLAMTFNRMLERLELAFEMQKSFVSNASHELRTPLTSITGQIEVLLLKSRTEKEYKETLESVLEDIRELNKLSNGLLDLAKASSDVSSITFRSLRIDEIIWETRAELTKRKNNYIITIIFTESIEDEKHLTVLGNIQLLKTALLNLMDNGCKFSSDHSVMVSLSLNDQMIVLTFTDQGIGIPKDDIDKLLQPFFRAANAKSYPGNGLGIVLSEKIISLHKGSFMIESQVNVGTRITITLPLLM